MNEETTKLQNQVSELQKKVDALYSDAGFPDIVLNNLVRKGFIKVTGKILTYLSPNGREDVSLIADFGNESGLLGYTPRQFLVSFTANASTDVITTSGLNLPTGATVIPTTLGGVLPAPLVEGSVYYARDSSGATCKLAAGSPSNPAENLTTNGAGKIYLLVLDF